jgi:anti-anti-sigma factor
VIDLERLTYISSMGLRALAKVGRGLRDVQGRLALAGALGPVKEILDLAGFTIAFPVFPSTEAAVESLGAG